jgi:hypothetical protein
MPPSVRPERSCLGLGRVWIDAFGLAGAIDESEKLAAFGQSGAAWPPEREAGSDLSRSPDGVSGAAPLAGLPPGRGARSGVRSEVPGTQPAICADRSLNAAIAAVDPCARAVSISQDRLTVAK